MAKTSFDGTAIRMEFDDVGGGKTTFFKNSDYGDGSLAVKMLGHRIFGKSALPTSFCESTYNLHYIVSGIGIFDGIEVCAGMGFLVCPNKSHTFATCDGSLMEHYWISFFGNECYDLLTNSGISNENHAFYCPWYQEIIPILENSISDNINTKKISSMFSALLKYVLSYHEGDITKPHEMNKGKEYVRATKMYIDSRYREHLTAEEIASNVKISSKYLYSLFLKYENISLQGYILKIRMARADEMLTTTKIRINEIAKAVGYDDPLQFSKMFNKYKGISPSKYRKNEPSSVVNQTS